LQLIQKIRRAQQLWEGFFGVSFKGWLGAEVCKTSPLAGRLAGRGVRAQAHPKLAVPTATTTAGGGEKGRGFSLLPQQIAILYIGVKSRKV